MVHGHCLYADHRQRGSQSSRRLILRISVGWVPPDVYPSGAGLARGPRVSCRRFTRTRMAPHRGGLSSDGQRVPPEYGVSRAIGTSRARAQTKAAMFRAIATTTWLACFPRAVSCRNRVHKRTWAFQLLSWMAFGNSAKRHGSWRLPWAGDRSAHAPAMRARRANVWPALVMGP